MTIQTEHWTFGGTDLLTNALSVLSLTGADDFPALRGENAPLATLTGRQWLSKLADQRQVDLGIRVKTTDASGVTNGDIRQQSRANLDALYAVLAPGRGQQSLVRTMPDASTRTATAECVNVRSATELYPSGNITLIATFMLADPWFYGANVTDLNRTVSASPTNFTITHPGTVEGYRVQFDILGAITNPKLTNNTTGVWWQYTGTVNGSQHLLVDCGLFTATNNSVNAIGSITHLGAAAFMTFAPGANSMSLTGSSITSAKISTTFSPPYV